MEALRRPALPEDAVRYRLFAAAAAGPGGEALLRRCAELALVRFAPLLAAYVWQRQPFRLRYVPGREAADFLPKWLNPANSENRVFFYKGELHIIPLAEPSEQDWPLSAPCPTVPQALALLSTRSEEFLAAEPIRAALGKRIQGYPEQIQASLHRARCFLPAGIAAVLRLRPSLVAAAVQAFYLRAAGDLRACRRPFRAFPAEQRVMALVTFTRCLYAQLVQQKFVPDRRSGYTLPAPSHPQYRAHELGMKLAHGFEILCSKSSKVAPDAKRSVLSSPLWERFLRSLKEKDYFKGEMEGSAKYLELLHMAEDHFQRFVSMPEGSDEVRPGDEILTLLQTTSIDLKEFEREAAFLPPEDDDSWLDIAPDALDQMLKEARNESLPSTNEEEQNYDLETVAESMKTFVSKVSTHEGAEMPCFDVDSFTKALNRILGEIASLFEINACTDFFAVVLTQNNVPGRTRRSWILMIWMKRRNGDDEDLAAGDQRQEQKVSPEELVGSLKAYMKEMDRELAQTNVGKSFTTQKRGASSVGAAPSESAGPGCGAEDAELAPVDVDMNLVANLLESYSAQAGLAGPTSNILQSLGVNFPENTELTGS
ncbi:hypothetical protein DV515_00011522 [Chloebia gouldiae]|uniref:Uncharacterized protein n=1 Tax=Chloebia gouldiae TaxID=44316 RepID=A0A3L8S633_CHLGU|nr:hypothetical protein DV515_00011522 [Chloebia gouldiae]